MTGDEARQRMKQRSCKLNQLMIDKDYIEAVVSLPKAQESPEPAVAVMPHVQQKKTRRTRTPGSRDAAMHQKGRLPDMASFHAVYNAPEQIWTGTLIITGYPEFGAQASGVFRLMANLDEMFRACLADQNGSAIKEESLPPS